MKKLSAIILALALLLTALSLTACGGTSLDLKDFTTVEFKGVDGNAKATIEFDFAAFEEAYSAANGASDPLSEKAVMNSLAIFDFESSLAYEVSPSEGLSTGDTVTVSFAYNEEIAKQAKLSLKNTTYTMKVTELTPAIEVDAFDPAHFGVETDVMIEYNGVAPEGRLGIYNKMPDTDPLSMVTYTVEDPYEEHKYGENITITASLPANAEDEGYVLKEETYEYPLVNVDHYLTEVSDLDPAKDQIKGDVLDAYTADSGNEFTLMTGDWIDSTDIQLAFFNGEKSSSNIKANNIYLLKEKNGHYSSDFYATVSADLTYEGKTYPITGIYHLDDLIVKADNSIEYDRTGMDGRFYADEDEAYQKVLNPLLKEYNIEKISFE